MKNNKSRGFSLVEAMLVVAIIGVLVAMAVPSYHDMIERNRLKQAIETLKSDLQWMRTETIKKSCSLRASFTNSGAWSYQIFIPPADAGTPCAIQQYYHGCTAAVTAAATTNCNIKTVTSAEFPGTTMGAVAFFSSPTTEVEFDFRRGEAKRSNNNFSNGRVELSSSNYSVKVVVAPVGRVRICNIDDLDGLSGYTNC